MLLKAFERRRPSIVATAGGETAGLNPLDGADTYVSGVSLMPVANPATTAR